MILFLPLVSLYLCLRSNDKAVIFVSVLGFVFAVVECFLIAVFSYMHKVLENNIFSNFIYFFLKENLLPLLVGYLVFFFITKDEKEFRIKALFPFSISFFAVYLPYFCIASDGVMYSFFELFLKPVMIFTMLFFASDGVYKAYKMIQKKAIVKAIFCILFVLFSIAVPSMLEALWNLKYVTMLVYFTMIVFALGGVISFFISLNKENSVINL